jgi:hypothetical protein
MTLAQPEARLYGTSCVTTPRRRSSSSAEPE